MIHSYNTKKHRPNLRLHLNLSYLLCLPISSPYIYFPECCTYSFPRLIIARLMLRIPPPPPLY